MSNGEAMDQRDFRSVLQKLELIHEAEVGNLVQQVADLEERLTAYSGDPGDRLPPPQKNLESTSVLCTPSIEAGIGIVPGHADSTLEAEMIGTAEVTYGSECDVSERIPLPDELFPKSPKTSGSPRGDRKVSTRTTTSAQAGLARSVSTAEEDRVLRLRAEEASAHLGHTSMTAAMISRNISEWDYGTHTTSMPMFARNLSPWRRRIFLMVKSYLFDSLFTALIVANSIFLGVRVHVHMEHPAEKDNFLIVVFEYTFTGVFALELVLRFVAEGMYLLRGDNGWIYLDLVVVGVSAAEVFIAALYRSSVKSLNLTNVRVIRVVRLIRLIKAIRLARVVNFLRALRTLVLSIIHTMRSVVWAYLLLFMVIYVFSLIIAQVVTNHIDDITAIGSDVPYSLQLYWGTLPRSILTLYKTISSGVNWGEVVYPLADVHSMLVVVFLVFISFTIFAFLNVITGVFCEAAIESARQDDAMMIQQHHSEKKQFLRTLYSLFGVDPREEFELGYLEFAEVLKDPQTKAYLSASQLDFKDAWELFKLLDTREMARIDVKEFVNGCLRLKGAAKAIDVAKLSYEFKIRHTRFTKQLRESHDMLLQIKKDVARNSRCVDPNPRVRQQVVFGPKIFL